MKFCLQFLLALFVLSTEVPTKESTVPEKKETLPPNLTETAIVFPSVGNAYIRGQLQKNKLITIVYSPLRMGPTECKFINVCWKYDGLIQKRTCSHEISREAAFQFEFNIKRAGTITFDFIAQDNGRVCASEENIKFKIKRKGIFN